MTTKAAEKKIDREWARVRREYRNGLKKALKERDVSQSELAGRYGAGRAFINNILREAPNMTMRLMVALAFHLGYRVRITWEER